MKNIAIILLISLIYLLGSCISYEKFPIEVYKPADFTVPAKIKNVTIVYRNLKYQNDTLQNYYLDNFKLKKDKKTFNSDSIAVAACIDSLSLRLAASGKFEKVTLYPSLPETRVQNVRHANIDWYNKICNETSSDGLILLDMFSCFYRLNSNPAPSAWVITSNIWSFYDSYHNKITDRYSQVDTLYWDGENNKNKSKIMIPGKKPAIKLAAGVIGANYSKHILPGWNIVYRDIMTRNHPEMKEAELNAKNNKWEIAEEIWQNNSNSKCFRNRTISLYNLALANEMKGNIDTALNYCSQAAAASRNIFLSSENAAVRKYAIVLHRRKNDLLKLQNQNEN